MTELTAYATESDAYVYASGGGDYATAREGAGDIVVIEPEPDGGDDLAVGQQLVGLGGPFCFETVIGFDTSAIPDLAAVTNAVLSTSATISGLHADIDFLIEARVHDWGPGSDPGDFVPGSELGDLTLVASLAASALVEHAYTAFDSESAFLTAVNTSGVTRLVLCSSRHRLGVEPPGDEYVQLAAAEYADGDLTPRLVVTYDLVEAGVDFTQSTDFSPRGNSTDPLREVINFEHRAGVVYDVLSCQHRYLHGPRHRTRRCPLCVA